jgi:hypothetical protein
LSYISEAVPLFFILVVTSGKVIVVATLIV